MVKHRSIATGIFVLLLVAPLAAPMCAAGLCDMGVACPTPMRPAGDDGPELNGPSCCLSLSASLAGPDLATRDAPSSTGVTATAALPGASVPEPSPARPLTRPSHYGTGRTTLTLHSTLLL